MAEEEDHVKILLKKVKYQPTKDNYNALGNAHFDLQQYDDALSAYQKALEIDPSDASILTNVGNALYYLDAFEQSVQYLRQSVALDQSDATAWIYLGNSLYALEQADAAMGCYQKTLEIDPQNLDAHCSLGNTFHDTQDFKKAVEYYEKALKIDPNDPMAWANLGNSRRYLKDYAGAEEAFKKALEIEKGYAFALFGLGRYYYDLGHFDLVKNLYQQLIAIVPDDSEPHLLLGDALAALEDYAGALASYGQAISLDPSDAMGYACRGWVYLQLRRFPEAEADLRMAAQLDPEDSYSLLNFAYCLALEGKLKPARGLLLKSTKKLSSDMPDSLLDAAKIALLLQDAAWARKFLEQALLADPDLKKRVQKDALLVRIQGNSPAQGQEQITPENLPKPVGRVISLSEINRIEFLTELRQGFGRVERVLGMGIIQLWEQFEKLQAEMAALQVQLSGAQEQKEILVKNQTVEKASEINALIKTIEKRLGEDTKTKESCLQQLVSQLTALNINLEGCDTYFEEVLEDDWSAFEKVYGKFQAGSISSEDFLRTGMTDIGKRFLKILAGRANSG